MGAQLGGGGNSLVFSWNTWERKVFFGGIILEKVNIMHPAIM